VYNTVPAPAPVGDPQPPRRRPGADAVLTLANGVLAGVGGVYATTHSTLITIIATVAAIALAAMILITRK
jgi:hypothetical protein